MFYGFLKVESPAFPHPLTPAPGRGQRGIWGRRRRQSRLLLPQTPFLRKPWSCSCSDLSPGVSNKQGESGSRRTGRKTYRGNPPSEGRNIPNCEIMKMNIILIDRSGGETPILATGKYKSFSYDLRYGQSAESF